MTLALLPSPDFTGADLSARVNAAVTELRAARAFPSAAALLADATLAYGTGSRAVAAGDRIVTAEGHAYEVAASAASDHALTTAGGVRLYVLPGPGGAYDVLAFGAKGDGLTDDAAAIARAIGAGNRRVHLPAGRTYRIAGPIPCASNLILHCDGAVDLHQGASPFFFNVTNCSNVTFRGFRVQGRRASFTYPETNGAVAVDSRSRFAFVYGAGASNIAVESCAFDGLYSAAIYLEGTLASELPTCKGVRIEACRHTNGNFELAKIVLMGDVVLRGNLTHECRNAFASNALVANGAITTGCSDIRVQSNHFGPSEGTGYKCESLNGALVVSDNSFELNDFHALNLQQSATERADVDTCRDLVTITGNAFRKSGNYGIYGSGTGPDAVRNVTISGNSFDSCVAGGVYVTGSDWTVTGNSFVGAARNRSGVDVNWKGVQIMQTGAQALRDIAITGNLFDIHNPAAAGNNAIIQIGDTGAVNFSVDGLLIAGNLIGDYRFRGIWLANDMDADNVTVAGNTFAKSVADGTASVDIYGYNGAHALRWTIANNVVAQSILVNLTHAGSRVTALGNRVLGSEAPDAANGYQVAFNGARGAAYDLGSRHAQFASAPPASGSYRVGDIVWHSAPAAGGNVGWVCTTAGTPGTWKTFGAIAP